MTQKVKIPPSDSLTHTRPFKRVGMVARWKPVHLGHTPVLRALCKQAETALIGIGSSNRYNVRNPFTLDETTDMIRLVLREYDNYTLIPVPDLDDGPRWRLMVCDIFGPLDTFVTVNPYVTHLLAEDYTILKPVALVAKADRVAINGTMVRREMARGDGWKALVPQKVVDYIVSKQLDTRFRREFGLQTLALDTMIK